MSLRDATSFEGFSLAELREVVGRLVGEVRRLRSDNAALQASVDAQQATIAALRAENQALRDEVTRLKGLPPRPPLRPSGMEQATQPGVADTGATRPKLPRSAKRDRQAVTAERVLKVAVPVGSRFTRLDADRRKSCLRQLGMQPGRQRARFQADPLHRHPACGEERDQRLQRKRKPSPTVDVAGL